MEATQETLFRIPSKLSPRRASAWERFKHFISVADAQGGLIPRNVLPDVIGVSNQRVSQYIEEGRLTSYTLFGQVFVTASSFEQFLLNERKAGRPVKQPSKLSLLKSALKDSSSSKSMFAPQANT